MATAVLPDPTDYGNKPGAGPLRPGGQSVRTPDLKTDADLPSTRSPAADRQVVPTEKCRDLFDGDELVKERGQLYLPQHPAEKPNNYRVRLARSVFYNMFRNTVEGLAAFVFRRDPVLADDVPVVIRGEEDDEGAKTVEGHWENIDNAGTHGDVWLYQRLLEVLTAGHGAILVEYPATEGKQNAKDENPKLTTAPIRPYWVPILKEHILSWRTEVENGVTRLAQLVLMEPYVEHTGAYGVKEGCRYRVLYRANGVVGFRVLEVKNDRSVQEISAGTYPTQDEIPVAEITSSGRRDLFDSTPPLLGVANLNVAHYQQASDYAYSQHMTCVPIIFTAGVILQDQQGQQVEVGPNSGIAASDPNAKAMYVSHSGEALASIKSALDDLKADIATMGLAMLSPQKRVAETAEAKRIDKATTDSKLGVTARGLQDAVERALGFHAKYLRLPSGGSVTINRDFEAMTMTPEMMNAWAAFIATGFPKSEVVKALKQSGALSPDADEDEIVKQWQGEEDAKAELRDMENQTRAAAMFGLNGPPNGPPKGEKPEPKAEQAA